MIFYYKLLIILMAIMNITLMAMAILDSNWCGFVVEFVFFMFTVLLWWLFAHDID